MEALEHVGLSPGKPIHQGEFIESDAEQSQLQLPRLEGVAIVLHAQFRKIEYLNATELRLAKDLEIANFQMRAEQSDIEASDLHFSHSAGVDSGLDRALDDPIKTQQTHHQQRDQDSQATEENLERDPQPFRKPRGCRRQGHLRILTHKTTSSGRTSRHSS